MIIIKGFLAFQKKMMSIRTHLCHKKERNLYYPAAMQSARVFQMFLIAGLIGKSLPKYTLQDKNKLLKRAAQCGSSGQIPTKVRTIPI